MIKQKTAGGWKSLVSFSGGGSEPESYIKNASVNENTLTLTKKDDTTVEFTPTGGSEPSAYLKSASVSDNTLTLTNKDNTTVNYNPIPAYPTFDVNKKYILSLQPNSSSTAYELKWVEYSTTSGSQLITSDGDTFMTSDSENFIVREV